ncbi:MAG: hypothetical protein MJ179_04715 [Treponema sp.]|nr:hypothetical protein [Treponema sp.]
MKRIIKYFTIISFMAIATTNLFGNPFNSKLTASEQEKLDKGEVVIKNIDYAKNMCLNGAEDEICAKIVKNVKDFNPKYLAEIIQVKDYKGNENLPQKMAEILNNIDDYAGIPYWSERNERYYDLYSSAEIVSQKKEENKTYINANLVMEPFGSVQESIVCETGKDYLLYTAENTNNLKYEGITCVGKNKLKVYIYCVHKDDKWIIYGIGGVNAPHMPFLTERIRTSFINRIKTFCSFVFTKI